MARLFRILAVAAVLWIASAAGSAAAPLRTFYVDPAGNDSAAGSITSPWRTLQKAANTVRAGDLVIVRAGHYAGLYLTTSGTATDPITFRGDPGAIVDTQNPTTPDGINLEGASWVVIENFTVTGVPRAGIRAVLNNHVTIRGNTGDLNGRWGILTGFSDDLLIENNTMSRSQAEHGIYVGNSGDRPVIRHNVVWGNNANGIHMNGDLSQGGDGIISGAVVEGNVIHDNGVAGGSGINCDGVQSSIIRNNLLYNNHASGISLYQIDGGQPARNNQVLNNTIVMASDARWAINIQNASTGNVVRNNILFNQQSFRGSIAISADSLPGFVSDTNVIMDRFSADGGDTRVTLAAWRSATGQDMHSIIATPAALFVNFAGNDYHLSSTSPARDAGGTIANVTDDLESAPRPQGSAFDIGAYEFPATTGARHAQRDPDGQRHGQQRAGRHQLWSYLLGHVHRRDQRDAHGNTGRGLGVLRLVGWRMLGDRGVHLDDGDRDDGERGVRAGTGGGHGRTRRARKRQRHERARRHHVRHDVLGELPVGQLGRPHRDAGRRLSLRRLVGRRLLGDRNLHRHADERDDRHRDVCLVCDRRAHRDRLGRRDRNRDERAGRDHL